MYVNTQNNKLNTQRIAYSRMNKFFANLNTIFNHARVVDDSSQYIGPHVDTLLLSSSISVQRLQK